jgi:uncharacterized protein YdeI (YjbR/CyaY-like superfamily)
LLLLVCLADNPTSSISALQLRHESDKPKSIKKNESGVDVNGINHIDLVNRIVITPAALQAAFKENKIAEDFYNTLSFTCKKEYFCWIVNAKQEVTREKRVKETIEKLENKLKNPAAK